MMIRNMPWVVLVVVALLMAACRPTSSAVTAEGTVTTSRTVAFDGNASASAAGGTMLTVGADEFAFRPATWRVAAGQEVTVTFDNHGVIEHNWVILTAETNISKGSELSNDMVLFEFGSVSAGGSASRTFKVSAGAYEVICSIPGHLVAGMHGMLVVEP